MFRDIRIAILGAGAVIVFVIILLVMFKMYDYSPIYIIDPKIKTDSLDVAKLEILNKLHSEGVVLSASEYTSHISSFYNTMITFLIALFAIISFVSFYSVRQLSKKDIHDKLDDMLDDSVKFRTQTTQSVLGALQDSFVSRDEFDDTIEDLNRRKMDSNAIDNEIENSQDESSNESVIV